MNHKFIIKRDIIKNLIMCISVTLFVVITITKLIHHIPWFDESHAWMLSQSMDISNVYYILKSEGHFIIWYLLIMPFAKLNLWYPYSMFIINWLCFFFAILLMWKKAPFNTIAKIIITFSWVSLNYYSIVARCYSVGILGLFIIAALYKKQLEKSVLYATALVLTAHTSLVATMAVIPFTIIFIYNLVKNKQNQKNIIIPLVIIAIGVILWAAPFVTGFGHPALYDSNNKLKSIIEFFQINHYYLFIYYIVTLTTIFIFADKKIKFFILMTTGQFYIFHSIFYPAVPHNILFVFVYIIVAYWLTPKIHNIKEKPVVIMGFLVFFALLLFINQGFRLKYALNNFDKSDLIRYLNDRPNKEYIYMNWEFCEILPYLDRKYKFENVHWKYDPKCLNNTLCAPKAIKKYMNGIRGESNIVIITSEKLNDNSVSFKWNIPNEKSVIWYATVFEKK